MVNSSSIARCQIALASTTKNSKRDIVFIVLGECLGVYVTADVGLEKMLKVAPIFRHFIIHHVRCQGE
jgi:hypothetical protein